MNTCPQLRWFLTAGVALVLLAGCGSNGQAVPDRSQNTPETAGPRFFATPQDAVAEASRLLAAGDWPALARCYDLSLTPQVTEDDLVSGRFFEHGTPAGTQPSLRRTRPFPPGSEFVEAQPVGDESQLPCVWSVTTRLSFDAGGGMMQRVMYECRMLHTQQGYRFLPPAPVEDGPGPSPEPQPEMAWGARGSDPALFLRPALRERVARELPDAGARNVADLVAAIERLKPLAAAHPGSSRPRGLPWEPETVYVPSDEELLLTIAGDRVWRTTQIAPPGTLADLRRDHPDLPASFEYPHIEVSRIEVAGTGPQYLAVPPQLRRVMLGEVPQ